MQVTNFHSAVMKMDIEGYEHRAFTHADQLLSEVRVRYVFMAWLRMRQLHETPDKRLVQRMIDTLASRQYLPYGITESPPRTLDLRAWYAWPDDVVWVMAGSVEPKKLTQFAPEVPSSKLVRS